MKKKIINSLFEDDEMELVKEYSLLTKIMIASAIFTVLVVIA